MLSLNIDVQCIELRSELISVNDKIRVSITTIPDNQKQAQIFEAKKLNFVRPSFKIRFNEATKKILIVIRKKNYFEGDPIIASTTIHTYNISNIFKERNSNDQKRVNLYESIKNTNNNPQFAQSNQTLDIIGHIDINFSVNEDKSIFSNKKNNKENKKYNDLSKMNSFKKENEYLLLDNNFN